MVTGGHAEGVGGAEVEGHLGVRERVLGVCAGGGGGEVVAADQGGAEGWLLRWGGGGVEVEAGRLGRTGLRHAGERVVGGCGRWAVHESWWHALQGRWGEGCLAIVRVRCC